jgi:hypothetical protein
VGKCRIRSSKTKRAACRVGQALAQSHHQCLGQEGETWQSAIGEKSFQNPFICTRELYNAAIAKTKKVKK